MKSLVLFGVVGMWWSAFAQEAATIDAAKSLARAGNHREAAEAFQRLVKSNDAGLASQALPLAVEQLVQLNESEEAETLVEQAAKDHATHWQVLASAGRAVGMLNKNGPKVDGKVQRNRDGQGPWGSLQQRDHVRSLQLFLAARKLMPADAPIDERGALLFDLVAEFATNQRFGANAAWKLTSLTDLTTLPDDDGDEFDGETASGFPIDAKGAPVVFAMPASFEDAKSDGERLRFLLKDWSNLGPENALGAKAWWAMQAKQLCSVRTISFLLGNQEPDREKMRRDGIAALHTLTEDETVMALASGPARLTLPEDYGFLKQLREIASAPGEPLSAHGGDAWQRWGVTRQTVQFAIVDELIDRRQLTAAAKQLRAMMGEEKNLDRLKQLTDRVEQIEGPWGRFEPAESQPSGIEAKLPLVFRNAKHIDCTARRVNIAKVLEDVKAFLKTSPENYYARGDLYSIGRKVLDDDGAKYLTGEPVAWSRDLEPAKEHWDKRIDLATPLKDAGAWLVEGSFNGAHPTRALLWIESTTIVQTRSEADTHYFVCDAVTGAPLPKTKLEFFGYRREWKRDGALTRKESWHYTFGEFSTTTDANGVAKVSTDKLSDKEWLVVARRPGGALAFSGFDRFWFHDISSDSQSVSRIYTITDRPVYRPGQEVKWQLWARNVGYSPKLRTNSFVNDPCEVVITNPRGEKVLEKVGKLDESGSLADMLKLDADATLGVYQVSIKLNKDGPYGSHSFRVEEYKKPEFEVKVSAPEKAVKLGDAFEFNIKADYYFGGPVKQAKVKYTVKRTQHRDRWFPANRWDWLFGDGYAWNTRIYDWYPGSRLWCGCFSPWIPWRSDPPETVQQGETAIGADGKLKIKVSTALAQELHGDQDHRYTIDVEVTDQSRRTIRGSGSVIAARRAFEAYVWLNRGWYRVGDQATAQFQARTLDGRDIKATGKLRVLKVSYAKDSTPKEESVFESDVSTDKPSLALEWPSAGQYRVELTLKDDEGHEAASSAFVVVRGDRFDGKDYRFDDLELALNKEEYQPGDEVELAINTNRSGSTVALFIFGGKREPVMLHLEGKSMVHRFKLSEADQPGISVGAYTVTNAQLRTANLKVVIPPNKRIATVTLETNKHDYQPRDKAVTKIVVKDQNGQPFIGNVVLTAYDKALEYISGGSNVEDIRKFFWGWTHWRTLSAQASLRSIELGLHKKDEIAMQTLGAFGSAMADNFTLSGGFGDVRFKTMSAAKSAAPMPASAAAAPARRVSEGLGGYAAVTKDKAEAGEASAKDEGVMIRTNLADSALWITSVKTNEAGEATLDFPMPDNLTTWKLRSWVMGKETQVGEATVEVVTRKDLMVRLQAPRFFVENDEATISVNVHNETDRLLYAVPTLSWSGVRADRISGNDGRIPEPIPAHGEKRFDWRLQILEPGEIKLTAKALGEDVNDAMEMKFPVLEHGIMKTDSWSLALRDDQPSASLKFTVPGQRKPETTKLEVRYSPTLAMALIDALPYLADYPYGCTEQTLNRFVPTVLTLQVLRDLGIDLKSVRDKRVNLNAQEIGDPQKRGARWQHRDHENKLRDAVFNEAEVKRMARAGLSRLEAMRDNDGGWGWFPGGRESSAHITALVMHGLQAAKAAGMEVDDIVLDQGQEWLGRHELRELARMKLDPHHRDHKAQPDDEDALIHSVLVERGRGNAEMRAALYQHRESLSRQSVALLGLACDTVGDQEKRDMCLRNLRQFVKQDDENQTAWLNLPENTWWYWWGDRIETQATFLKLLCRVEPKGELAARVAKHLLNNRRNGYYWNNTRDTAAVIEALAVFVKASGESNPTQTIEVVIDGEVKKTVHVSAENLFAFDNSLLIEGEALRTGEHTLELRKQGGGPLYANAYLTMFSKEDMIPAAGLEVKVQRKFYKLTEVNKQGTVSNSRGNAVTQQVTKYDRTELKSGTPLKSGDLVEVELLVESKNDYEYVLLADPKPAGFEPVEVRSGWRYDGLAAYQEYRDEKVAFFASRLPQGTHTLTYRVKAEVPGFFSALPSKVEAMYAPELRGNANEWKASIGD